MAKIKITYENLTPALRVANKRRIIGTVIGWIVSLLSSVIIFIAISSHLDEGLNYIAIGMTPLFGWASGGIITGFFHIENLRYNLHFLLWIPIIGWAIWFVITLFCSAYVGLVVIITNIFRILFRKPLISKNEIDKLERLYG